jgi:hypothetical protein
MPEYFIEEYADSRYVAECSRNVNAAVLSYANACISAKEGYFDH